LRITYEWTEREWDEAVGVATRKPARGAPLPSMIYALVGIPLLGAAGDLISLVRASGRVSLAGSLLPLLLVLFALTAAALIVARRRRRRQRDGVCPMPRGTREMVLQEAGWRFTRLQPQALLPSEASAGLAPSSGAPLALRSWSDVVEARQGNGVVVLVHLDGFDAVPGRSLTPEQAGHLHRLVMRKMR